MAGMEHVVEQTGMACAQRQGVAASTQPQYCWKNALQAATGEGIWQAAAE
jgi:hypothetical protein